MIYINTNLEVLADYTRDDAGHSHPERAEQAMDSVGCWGVLADDAGLDWQTSPIFRDWNGGRHDQHHTTIGELVAYNSPEEAEIAHKIADAMAAALEGAQ